MSAWPRPPATAGNTRERDHCRAQLEGPDCLDDAEDGADQSQPISIPAIVAPAAGGDGSLVADRL